jgi:branched-subunit amino acid aminotransferase/4-amino-4-deoxychorismate lyase
LALLKNSISSSWKWERDKFVECDSVSLADRGFRYGMGLFETIRIGNGHPRFLAEHLCRLGVDSIKQGLGSLPDVKGIERLIPSGFEGVMRLFWTAGPGSPLDEAHGEFFVSLESRKQISDRQYRVQISEKPVLTSGAKTLNYWQNVLLFAEAQREGFDETVLWSWDGELSKGKGKALPIVVSAAMANLFWVRGGQLFTPAQQCGARAGVIRNWVMERAEVCEVTESPAELQKAEALFITNSWIGIVPIEEIDGIAKSIYSPIKEWNLLLQEEKDN